MIIYFGRNPIFDISVFELDYMLKNNDVECWDGKYRISKNGSFRYIFSNKIKEFKKIKYLKCLAFKKFICEDCGKEHSYNIRPDISNDGTVNFDKVICVCKECRTKALKKRDILKPVYKQEIDWEKEINRINKEINKYKIKDAATYMALSKEILTLDLYVKLVLPQKRKYYNRFIIKQEQEIENYKSSLEKELGENINLKKSSNRKKVREFLYKEGKGICPICGMHKDKKEFTIDHIIARKLGGTNSINNFIGMCNDCNSKKGHKTVLELLISTELSKMPSRILNIAYEQQEQAKENVLKYKKELEKMRNKSKNDYTLVS